MSHVDAIMRILEREELRRRRKLVRYAVLHAALDRSHVLQLRSAKLIEQAEAIMQRAGDAR